MTKQEYFFVALVVASFAHGVFHPGWSSVMELALSLSFIGYYLWLSPERKSEVKREELTQLINEIALLKEQVHFMRVKIGFVKGA